jgi:hypothetical protein
MPVTRMPAKAGGRYAPEDRTTELIDMVGSSLTDGLERLIDVIDQSSDVLRRSVRSSSRRRGRAKDPCAHEDPCAQEDPCCDEPCGHEDPCHCMCCVVDADLVVEARLGELRIVPITLHNERKREREISLELSPFTTRGGKPAPVTGMILPPTKFTLKACEERTVVVGLIMREQKADGDAGEQDVAAAMFRGAAAREQEAERVLPDVDDCLVAYGHLRIDGCDVRPVRIAVALLPRDCGVHQVHCACGCC